MYGKPVTEVNNIKTVNVIFKQSPNEQGKVKVTLYF